MYFKILIHVLFHTMFLALTGQMQIWVTVKKMGTIMIYATLFYSSYK